MLSKELCPSPEEVVAAFQALGVVAIVDGVEQARVLNKYSVWSAGEKKTAGQGETRTLLELLRQRSQGS